MKIIDYENAKAGERHGGFYRKWKDKRTEEIEKSIRSLQEQIDLHQNKINNPDQYIDPDVSPQQRDGLINRYWPKEILNFQQQINVLKGILSERKP
ncbi:MAG: hypothetical protein PHE55_20535 [Methylococcaceae bacterium]|nr:hypothetical protein [Methylococcaceae bacterium]